MSLSRLHDLCIDVRVLGIDIFMRYFLGIVGIVGFCYFVIFFPNRCNTSILQSCTPFL